MNTKATKMSDWQRLWRGVIMVLVLLCAALPGRAQTYYVFYNGTNGYIYNDNGTPRVTTTFSPSCIWQAPGALPNSNTGLRTLQSYISTSYMNGSNGSLTLGNSGNATWRLYNSYLTSRTNNSYYYVKLSGGNLTCATGNSGTRFYAATVTINNQAAVNPTISITAAAGLSGGGIQLTGNITGSYTPAYSYASVHNYQNNNNTTYYWTATTEATTMQPTGITSWGDATLTWTVTTGGTYASINSDGLLTITANPTGNVVVRLGVSKGGYTNANAATITLTRAAIAQSSTTETVISGPSISPSSAALYYNEGSQAFTSSASATATTTTVPAHTTLTGGGNTYYYYNGTLYTTSDDFRNITETHPAVTLNWALSGAAASNLTRTPASGTSTTVTHTTQSPSDQTATLTVTASTTGASNKTATATITAYGPMVAPTITRSGNTISLATTSTGATIYYTTDGTTPSASSTPYTGSFALTTSPTTVKAIAIRDGHNSTVATETFQIQLAAPAISISNTGLATITAEAGATIHYTTDGSTPTASSPTYSTPVQLSNPQTIMAIAVRANYVTSDIAMEDYITGGVAGGMVILDDREDHTWTYYAGVDASVDGGNYNTNYLGKLYSPNPRNVKIVYNGVNGITGSSITVKVSRTENETSFVYYKTLEQGSTSGEYPYQVISNPFSVRPSTGTGNSKVYYGFAGWKIVSGGEYIKNHNNNDVLALDEEIVFNNLPYPAVNCTSAEIVFQTTWTTANVQTGNNIATMLNSFNGGTYETNFAVMTGQYTTAWTGNKNATITSVYPDGSSDVRSTTNYTRPNVTVNDGYTIKYEYININNNNSTLSMGSGTKTLYIGRGVSNTTANGVVCNLIQGYDGTINSGGLTYTLKIESGIYNIISFIKGYNGSQQGNTVTGTVAVKGVLGCDYDRANNDNSKLKIQDHPIMGYANAQLLRSPAAGSEVLNVTIKSGSLNSNLTSAGTADVAESFYIGIGGQYSPGARVLTVEGGEMWSIAAGICQNTATTNSIRFRIKGGLIKGSIYGSAANANSYGYKQMIITGGHIKGWIAGGGNGTSANGGTTTGSSYIYVGGNARVDSEGSNTNINSSLGGQVFGSGSGVQNTTTWGEMLYGSNVVIADNAYVERNVFGGGNYGWTDETATIYLTGENMSVGNVYGGANQNKGDYVNIYMTGGTVRDGLYGGSNTTGTVGYNVNMHINGGTVGNSETGDGIFGGGYGSGTIITGNVNITLGASTSATDSATVYGNVYGGSALGRTNNGNANNTTTVTMNKALVNGNLFGGALGNGAVVNGKITVTVNGGRVNGSVFGGGDAASYSPSSNHPVVNMTGGQVTNVFGGGKGNTATVTGNPQVTLSGNAHVTGNVYGGGDAAPVTGQTNVQLRD